MNHSENLKSNRQDQIKKQTANGRTTPWCRRAGHNRICLTCGKNAKCNPGSCTCPQHSEQFRRKRAYQQAYWLRNKERLLKANQKYRETHPQTKLRNRVYHQLWYLKNRCRKLAQNRRWEARNKTARREYCRRKALAWYRTHPERAAANCRRYYQLHKARKNTRRNEKMKAARLMNPGYRVLCYFRSRLATLIRRDRPKTYSFTRDVLPYTQNELRSHLEKQFRPGMNWQNYGKLWEVDHIRPCATFDLTDIEQCRQCFALNNLRPLERSLNRGRYFRERGDRAQQAKASSKSTTGNN